MKKLSNTGFTIVELLIVIVVIGILAALVIVTFQGVQSKGRDTERQTDIKALYGHVEAYYASNGRYPSLANLNDASWRSANLKGLDNAAFKDPQGANDQLATTPGVKKYSYEVTAADGSACDNSTTECALYTLTATLENGGPYVRTNLD